MKGSPKNFKNFKTFAIKYGGRKIGKISRESTPPKIINFMSKKYLLFCKIINFVKPFGNLGRLLSPSDISEKLSHHFFLHFPIGMGSYDHHSKYQGVFMYVL